MGSNLSDANSPLILRVRELNQTLAERVELLRNQKVIDTLIFDHLIADLQTGFTLFCQVTANDLATSGHYNIANKRTFHDLRRVCNVPMST